MRNFQFRFYGISGFSGFAVVLQILAVIKDKAMIRVDGVVFFQVLDAARATHLVSQAIERGNLNAINYFVATKYVDALQNIASAPNEKLIFMPMDASGVVGAIGGIAELAKQAMANQGGKV